MPPSSAQLSILWNLSDEVFYKEAIAFIHRLVDEEECSPLPASQVTGLLNIANASNYTELEHFIKHQRDRNWPESRKDIRLFYTELEKVFTTLKNKRLREMFHLEQAKGPAAQKELDELMILVAQDFIQHLITENALLAVEKASERARRR
jgi:hypothetical protein